MDRASLERDLASLQAILESPADRTPRHGPYDGLTAGELLTLGWLMVRLIRERLAQGLYDRARPVPIGQILARTEDDHAAP